MPRTCAIRVYNIITYSHPIFIAGLDYDETVSSLVFSGESTQSVVIRVIDDDLPEPPETFIGRL